MGFKYFKIKFFHPRTHQQNILSLSQSPEANHASWPDISAKVDLCVANCYSLAQKITDFSHFSTLVRTRFLSNLILVLFFAIKSK